MVDINFPNFITVGLIAVIFVVAMRWAMKAMGKESIV